jgi:phage baseplate assembly protein gpV
MADPRELWNDHDEAMRTAFERERSTLWTALPVLVSEDSEGHTVKLKSAIQQAQQNRDDGSINSVEMSEFGEVPVCYAQGGGFIITHPVKKDDEGLIFFMSRCIDGWHQHGGVQAEMYRRRHHQSDGMYIPGIRSDPRKIGGQQNGQQPATNGQQQSKPPSTNSVQIRVEDGKYYIELTSTDVNIMCKNCTITAEEKVWVKCKNAEIDASEDVLVKCRNAEVDATQNVTVKCQEMDVSASSKVRLDTPRVEITGSLYIDGDIHWHGGTITSAGQVTMDGNITTTGQVRAGSVGLTSHHHTGVQGGTSVTGPPVG